jgi:hypothetical protein
MVPVYISSRTYDARCKNGLGRFLTFPERARTVLPPHPTPLPQRAEGRIIPDFLALARRGGRGRPPRAGPGEGVDAAASIPPSEMRGLPVGGTA